MSSFLQELESTIAGLETETVRTNVGVVREVGAGVAKIEGLSDVKLDLHEAGGQIAAWARTISIGRYLTSACGYDERTD